MNHVTIGVYANGDYKVNIVKPEHLEVHLEYNRTMRSGRALFLDGKCVQQGYLGDNHIAEWTERIAAMNIDTATPSKLYW